MNLTCCFEEQEARIKGPIRWYGSGLERRRNMLLSIRRNKGKAEIRIELGDFAITLEIPV
jgi:hypothetical protein